MILQAKSTLEATYHVFDPVNRRGVHYLDLAGILGRDPVLILLVIQQLDLACVWELDTGSYGQLKLPTLCAVEPHLVSLDKKSVQVQLINVDTK